MKTIFKLLIAFLAVAYFQSGFAANFTLPEYKQVTLENGLTIMLMEQHEVPLIDVNIRIKAGTVDSDVAGLADVTASSLMFGAGKLSKSEIDSRLDFIGANVSTSGGKEQSRLVGSFAKKDQQQVLKLITEILREPSFEQAEIDKYLARYATEIEQRQESPKSVIGDYFNKMVFSDSPYAKQIVATKVSLKKIDRKNILAFYKMHYQPQNMVIAVAGDFETNAMQKQITALFSDWKKGNMPAKSSFSAAKKPAKSQVTLVNKSDAIETTFQIGGKGIPRGNADFVAIEVINTILGGRFTSWLNDELRVNTGLTYGARSRFNTFKHDGSFYISTFTKTSTTEEAIDLALKTYHKLWEQGIDQATLDSAKAYVKGQFPPKFETSTQLADLMADMAVLNFDKSFINDFSKNVDNLTTEKAKAIINKYFPKDNLQFVLIGKSSEIRDIAKKYGDLIETDIKG